ncbi:MAG: hypothetical protein ACXADY_05915 [Candidatus Hodarchaeales archaeon]
MTETVVQESKIGDWLPLSFVASLGATIYFFINSLLQSNDLAVPLIGSIIVFVFLYLLLSWETSKWKNITIKKWELEQHRPRSITISVIVCIIMYFIVTLFIGMLFALVLSIYLSFSIYTNRLKLIEYSPGE